MRKTNLFSEFIKSERAGGYVLLACTFFSLVAANIFPQYVELWQWEVSGHSITHWVNEALMAIFFLLVGLELEREIYVGELSTLRKASLPAIAALGGMVIPAGFYFLINMRNGTIAGAGIPMATDIAFALGILSLVGKRVPSSLRVFLTALAVIDDLGAIIVIALFYATALNWVFLGGALGIFGFLLLLNKFNIQKLWIYLVSGVVMWYFMLHSGVHASIAGVLVAFAIPFGKDDEKSISYKLQHSIHYPVAFVILPIFALANTAILIDTNFTTFLTTPISLGIMTGLILGKPIGIFFFSYVATKFKVSVLPAGLRWSNILGIGFLGGIGFTMSIFITILSFNDVAIVDQAKVVVIIASLISGTVGFLWLKRVARD